MGRKTSIPRQAVEDAAFEIVRREGIEALSARRIGQVLGCSTQPVYTACGSMASVEAAVGERTRALVEQALADDGSDVPPLLRLGYATLELAKGEPHLFKLASRFISARVGEPPPPKVLAAMKSDARLAALGRKQLTEVHTLLWIFSQGLASLVGAPAPMTMPAARRALEIAGEAILEHAIKRANG